MVLNNSNQYPHSRQLWSWFFCHRQPFVSSILQLHLPLTTPLPGSELTKEPFRWDQRLFALVLRIPGNASVEPEPLGGVPPDDSPITPMCEVTGGRQTERKLVFGEGKMCDCSVRCWNIVGTFLNYLFLYLVSQYKELWGVFFNCCSKLGWFKFFLLLCHTYK